MDNEKFQKVCHRAKEVMANSDIYFDGHAMPISRQSGVYAKEMFNGSEEVCRLGGLLHDIGYTKNYEPSRGEHIEYGMKVAENILSQAEYESKTIDRVVDCIRTHDNNLELNSPIENIIVHDVDLLASMDQVPMAIELIQRFGDSYDGALERIRADVDKKREWISHPFFREMSNAKYDSFLLNLELMKDYRVE